MTEEEEKKARRREYNRQWREANREQLLERKRQYRNANLERERERSRLWREANRDQNLERKRQYRESNLALVRERSRQYRMANPERSRQWRAANPERQKEAGRQWRNANPDRARELSRQCTRIRRARKANAIDPCAPQATAAATASRVWLFGNCCAYCGSDGPLHLDHVEPLARGGLHTPDNLVPACQRCNLSKLAKPVESWYLSQPFFSPERWEALQAHTGRRWSAAEQLSLMDLLSA
jgi:5-methylcytosine-specific restriction endonuclease McrA